MKAIIMATEKSNDLSSIVEDGLISLLPIAGKPVIEYAIESLRNAGIRVATIVTSGQSKHLKSQVGNGCRWGMQISYSVIGNTLSNRADKQNGDKEETLVVQGDAFWLFELDSFLKTARRSGKQQVIATYQNQPIAKWLNDIPLDCAANHMNGELHSSLCVEQSSGVYHYEVSDYMGYFRVNMAFVNGQLALRQPSGRRVKDNLYLEVGATLDEQSVESLPAAFVGRNSHVHRTASLAGIVSIDSNVVIDRFATVENSIVLSGTYIGEMMHVKDSIVCGNTYVNIYTGFPVTIEDELIAAAM